MKWRFVDRVTGYEPWKSMQGEKAVSFEEYCLLEPFGLAGEFPRTLLIECSVELCSWLVAASSGFEKFCTLGGMEGFETMRTGPASLLAVNIEIVEVNGDEITAKAELSDMGGVVGRGSMMLDILPLADLAARGDMEHIWREIYAEA